MKLLTVTVPCYNSADYISKSIESLLVGGDRMEIIIIDDGSKDDTGVIADSYAAKYPDIVKVVHQPNGGHGEGINQGVANATGLYFRVCDSDDWVDGEALLKLLDKIEELEKTGGVDLIITNYPRRSEVGQRDGVQTRVSQRQGYYVGANACVRPKHVLDVALLYISHRRYQKMRNSVA